MKQSIKTPEDLREAIDKCLRNDGQAYLEIDSPKYVLIKDFQRDITNVLCSIPSDTEFGELSCFDFGEYNSFADYVAKSSIENINENLKIIIHDIKNFVVKTAKNIREKINDLESQVDKCNECISNLKTQVKKDNECISNLKSGNKEFAEKQTEAISKKHGRYIVIGIVFGILCAIFVGAAIASGCLKEGTTAQKVCDILATVSGVIDLAIGGFCGLYEVYKDNKNKSNFGEFTEKQDNLRPEQIVDLDSIVVYNSEDKSIKQDGGQDNIAVTGDGNTFNIAPAGGAQTVFNINSVENFHDVK